MEADQGYDPAAMPLPTATGASIAFQPNVA
jgi:hypothetical protein